MEGEDTSRGFIPFAKQSQMVTRCHSGIKDMGLAFLASQQVPSYSHEFWDRLSQQSSIHLMEEYSEVPPTLMSSQAVHRPDVQPNMVCLQELSDFEKLPSPRELCRRKKGRQKRWCFQNGRVMAAFYHLEDLKRRQGSIDQLKRLHWGGYDAKNSSENFEEGAVSCMANEVHEDASNPGFLTHLIQPNVTMLYQRDSDFLSRTPSHSTEQLFYPQESLSTEDQPPIPIEQPMISYMMASVDRYKLLSSACSSPESFWSLQHQSEE